MYIKRGIRIGIGICISPIVNILHISGYLGENVHQPTHVNFVSRLSHTLTHHARLSRKHILNKDKENEKGGRGFSFLMTQVLDQTRTPVHKTQGNTQALIVT